MPEVLKGLQRAFRDGEEAVPLLKEKDSKLMMFQR